MCVRSIDLYMRVKIKGGPCHSPSNCQMSTVSTRLVQISVTPNLLEKRFSNGRPPAGRNQCGHYSLALAPGLLVHWMQSSVMLFDVCRPTERSHSGAKADRILNPKPCTAHATWRIRKKASRISGRFLVVTTPTLQPSQFQYKQNACKKLAGTLKAGRPCPELAC